MATFRAVIGANIGHSSKDESVRRIGRKIPEWGFVEWHKQFYGPLLELGFTKFHRHNPGGARATGPMEFDQFLHLDALGLPGVCSASWVEGTRWLHEQGGRLEQKIETCDYLGAIAHTPAVRALVADPPKWNAYVGRCLEASLQAGSAIGLDAIANLPASHPVMDLRDRLADAGVTTFGEAWPNRSNARLHAKPVVCIYKLWRNAQMHPAAIGDRGWAARKEQLVGEVRVMCGNDREAIEQVEQAGHTPVISSEAAQWYAKEKLG